MRPGRPSATALRVAVRRAAHQRFDHPRVFDDPLALSILPAAVAAEIPPEPEDESLFSRSLRAFMAVRSRYAEDELERAIARGAAQCVILGAGLDTFAYRNPHPRMRVFEVDHPDTQEWKRHRLHRAGIPLPSNLAFAPVDFDRQTLQDGLFRAGFQPALPAFFSWLGVTPYLRRSVVLSTLAAILAFHPHNGVVFDYAVPRETLPPLQQQAFDALASRVAAAGEPFQSFFDPATLARDLAAAGYTCREDLDTAAINDRYFRDRQDNLRLAGSGAHLLSAHG